MDMPLSAKHSSFQEFDSQPKGVFSCQSQTSFRMSYVGPYRPCILKKAFPIQSCTSDSLLPSGSGMSRRAPQMTMMILYFSDSSKDPARSGENFHSLNCMPLLILV